MQKKGVEVLDQTHKCLNKQLSGFFLSFALFQRRPSATRIEITTTWLRVRPAPNILIMDEINLYVAIIVPNCFFEGGVRPAASG